MIDNQKILDDLEKQISKTAGLQKRFPKNKEIVETLVELHNYRDLIQGGL